MARRGYFEKQSGNYRLRLVEEGHDADDEGVPANKVVLDTNSLTLSVFRRGQYIVTSTAHLNGGVMASGWGLNYVPLCMFWYNFPSSPDERRFGIHLIGVNSPVNKMIVTNDGITVHLPNIYFTPSEASPLIINWVAFRLPVIQL